MENNNIHNNINNSNLDNDIEDKGNSSNIIEIPKNKDKEKQKKELGLQKNGLTEPNFKENNKKIKYRLNFSVKIDYLRSISDKHEKRGEVEFNSNILLMSSEINQSNKISCLTLISYCNHQRNYALYIYYLNKKIFKYLQFQKGIESFIYIRTLYRAAYFLEKDKNYFYANKYIKEADLLSKNSKINNDSKKLLFDLKIKVTKNLDNYNDIYIKKFKNIESSKNLNKENYIKLKKLMNDLAENKYNINCKENKQTDEYLYVINKKWFDKAYNFLKDYINVREHKTKEENYFSYVFSLKDIYNNYFDEEKTSKDKKEYKFNIYPALIDNYSISDWTDHWTDQLNEDENYFLQQNLIYNKDYFLLEKSDFEFLEYYFGATNVIKRKKDCLEFVIIKAIIFDKRFKDKETNFLLRRRNLQIRKNSTIGDFKDKIIRCVKDCLKKIAEEKEKLKGKVEKKENTDINNNKMNKINSNKKKEIKNDKIDKNNDNNNNDKIKEENNNINNDDTIKSIENENKEKTEIIEKKENEPITENNDKYNLYFYLLEKDKRNILIEMCLSFVNEISKYDSLYIKKINIQDNENITNLLSFFDKKKYILIIEIQHNEDPLFFNPIDNNKINKYFCSQCQKEIASLESENIYKCNICHFSLFCSEECSIKNKDHIKLDDILFNDYLVEEFDLQLFLKKDIKTILEPDQLKGLVGLRNLGNTCYMNSSLQCLSNTLDLTKYFLLKCFLNDINRGNRLGSNGSVANEYYDLIYSMWCGKEPIIAPKKFISNFQKEKKQFAGYRQQDAQEFISILLDQLHEDLNRISNKPYIELLEKQPDEDDMIASKRWWDLHKKREDSIIIDLFNGQLKSETTCQVCNKSSITYDPFMFLCLPLPKSKKNITFKIFLGIECKNFEFEYFDKCTLLDVKNSAFEIIKKSKNISSTNFDFEIAHLDKNKKIIQTIPINEKDKNNKGHFELVNLLLDNNEIIFYEKNIVQKKKEYIKIFIYPIENQKPEPSPYGYSYGRTTNLQFLSYPLFFEIKNDTKIEEFIQKVFDRLSALNLFNMQRYQYYKEKKQFDKILDLNIIHGKETKKEGFFSWFYIEDVCKYCNESNEASFYCSISNISKKGKTLLNIFQSFKNPIVLVATSDCFDFENGHLYIESKLENPNLPSNCINLKDCLDLYGEEIELKDDDMWYCSKCKKHQISKQKLKIYKSPNYLIVQIKRFNIKKNYGGDSSSFTGEKNDTFVSYPIEDFNLREYIVGPEKEKDVKYDLYGVVQHFGSLNGGHYTAICKKDGNWVVFNDSNLKHIDNPVTKNAYILFYKRKDLERNNENKNIKDNKDINQKNIIDNKDNKDINKAEKRK